MNATTSVVSPAEFARLRGVNKSTVTRWIQAGRIALNAQGKLDVQAATVALEATASPLPHHMARAEQIAAQKAGEGVAPPAAAGNGPATPTEWCESLGQRLKAARVKREEAEAESKAIALDREAKLLLPRADVEFFIDDFGRTLGNLLDRVADRCAPDVLARNGDANGIHAVLTEAMRDVRTEFAHYLRRKSETLL